MGELRWKVDQLTGRSLQLSDDTGKKLARLKSGGLLGSDEKLEILVACQDSFVDLVVLSGIAAKTITNMWNEAIAEGVGAVAGAAGAVA